MTKPGRDWRAAGCLLGLIGRWCARLQGAVDHFEVMACHPIIPIIPAERLDQDGASLLQISTKDETPTVVIGDGDIVGTEFTCAVEGLACIVFLAEPMMAKCDAEMGIGVEGI